ncbi:MAG: hypothetical protein ABL959_13610, partial [Pyrinomonadaceae bacterium]
MTPQESLSQTFSSSSSGLSSGSDVCPVCSRFARDGCVDLGSLADDVAKLIRANAPGAEDFEEICVRCARLFERAKDQIIKDAAVQKDGSHVLSTPLRLDADDRFTGKGVTIAFLDSGFYPHVDLKNRILGYRNMLHEDGDTSSL